MKFQKGDKVEVSSKQEGFHGSYFSAKILDRKRNLYLVQYDTLLKDDESGPLIEIVRDEEVRPKPPDRNVPVGGFVANHEVDAFDRDGWWVGKVSAVYGDRYMVFFDVWNVELCYDVDQLRVHQECVEGIWVTSSEFMCSY